MRQLSEYRTRKLLNERKQDGSLGTQNDISSNLVDDRYEMELEAKLNALGVKKLTQSEAEAIYSQSNSDEVSAMVTVPNSNANVKWYEIRYSHYKNNQSYDLQDLYAQGIGYTNGTKLNAAPTNFST